MTTRRTFFLGIAIVTLIAAATLYVSDVPRTGQDAKVAAAGEPQHKVSEEVATSRPLPRAPADQTRESRRQAATAAWETFRQMKGCADLTRWKNAARVPHGYGYRDLDPETMPSESQCAGVPKDMLQVSAALKRAVDLGSQEAESTYAKNPQLGGSPYFNIDAWREWRDRAPRLLDEAVDRGDVDAAVLRGLAAMDPECSERWSKLSECRRSFPLNAVLPRDNTRAYASLLFARQPRIGQLMEPLDFLMADLAEQLTEDQRTEAAARAEAMHARLAR